MALQARTVMRGRRMRLLRLAAMQCAAIAPQQRSWPLGLVAALSLGLPGCGGSDSTAAAEQGIAERSGPTAVAGRSEVAQAVSAVPTGSETWTFCGNEGDICRVPGTQLVRYGIDGAYVYQTVTDAIGCGNSQWPDPAFMRVKHCDVASSGATAPAPAPAPVPGPAPSPAPAPAPASWTFVANEYEAFSVSGTRTVRYGAGSKWVQRSVTGSGNCTNHSFGSAPELMTG